MKQITDLEDVENRGFLLGFDRCARIKDGLSITAFFAGVMVGMLIATLIVGWL